MELVAEVWKRLQADKEFLFQGNVILDGNKTLNETQAEYMDRYTYLVIRNGYSKDEAKQEFGIRANKPEDVGGG